MKQTIKPNETQMEIENLRDEGNFESKLSNDAIYFNFII
jgi:hypothetical protein